MAGVSSTQSLRKAIGVIKDSTKVGLAKVNSEYKDLDIAIVKATNHVERIAKEKHIRTIFAVAKASRPRADVAYCVYALARRLSKTHNWAVALKTLVVIHRALREVDSSFREELINYTKSRGHVLNLSHFKDDSSPTAWDYSAWVRVYALYLEERLECFRILNYDIEADRPRMRELDTPDLLEQLPALQRLLFRLLACQPEGAARYNNVIQYALLLVASESVRIYAAISDATLNLVDKFFEMQQHDAVRALELYKKTGNQGERLSEFYEICRGLEFGKRQKFIKIEQPPASFLATMEEYVKEAPRPIVLQIMGNDDRGDTKTEGESNSVLSIKPKSEKQVEDGLDPFVREPEASTTMSSEAPVTSPFIDLLGLDEINQDTSEVEENNPLALALINSDDPLNATNGPAEFTGWELALVTASSNSTAVAESKLAGGLDKLTLDSLYEDAMARTTNQNRTYHTGQAPPNPFETAEYMDDPFYASSDICPPTNVQMESTTDQHQDFMMEQQQQNQHTLSAHQHQDFMMEQHQDFMMEQQQQYQQPPSLQQEQDFTSDQHRDFMMEQHRDFMMEQQHQQYQQPPSAHQQPTPPVVSQNPTNPFGDPYEEHDVSSTGHSQNPCNYF